MYNLNNEERKTIITRGINNEILNRTLPKVKSSVKPIDLLNIAKYSESLGC